MLTIFVAPKEGERRALRFSQHEVTIGRVQGNHVVLPDRNVSRRHARVVVRDARIVLTDLKSTNGTYVNGRKCTAPTLVKDSDKIYIGEFTLGLECEPAPPRAMPPFLPRDRREAELLRAIGERDEASREIYADWLEEHGHAAEAEFVRVQQLVVAMRPGAVGFRERTQRLSELGAQLDARWRLRVARPAIENCDNLDVPRFSFECPKEWGGLEPTAKADVKFCGACRKQVYYCTSVPEARDRAGRGECVALDLRAMRWPADLAQPFGRSTCRSCKSDLGTFDGDDCPRCGAARYTMTVGMIA